MDTATERLRALDLPSFHARVRLLHNIDFHELVEAGVIETADRDQWVLFRNNPCRFLILADDETAEKLWALCERRAGRA